MDYEKAKAFVFAKLTADLLPDLTYHGIHHTQDVLTAALMLAKAEQISPSDTHLLKTAALFHDIGFTVKYRNHEDVGCEIARNSLIHFGYNPVQIEEICGMIMATKIPQTPKTPLEEILCDADLDYLGRKDFYPISNTLYREFLHYGFVKSEIEWDRLQIIFFESHHYFTKTANALRLPEKNNRLKELKRIVEKYDAENAPDPQ
jgi:uncharacterized protein